MYEVKQTTSLGEKTDVFADSETKAIINLIQKCREEGTNYIVFKNKQFINV